MEVKGLGQGGQNISTPNASVQNLNNNTRIENKSNPSQVNNVAKTTETKESQVNEKEVQAAVDKLNKLLEGKETHVEYERIGRAKHMGIRIVNTQTKEVIQELPPRKIVEMIDKLCELAGIMVDEKA